MQGISRTGKPITSHSFVTAAPPLSPAAAAHLAAAKTAQPAAARGASGSRATALQLVSLSEADGAGSGGANAGAGGSRRARVHFPAHTVVDANSMRMYARRIGASKPLGDKSVDAPVDLTPFVAAGGAGAGNVLKLSVAAETEATAGRFVMGVRFAQKATVEVHTTFRQLCHFIHCSRGTKPYKTGCSLHALSDWPLQR